VRRTDPTVAVSDQFAWDRDMVDYRTTYRAGFAVTDAAAFGVVDEVVLPA
jgi:hypothetical protein